MLRMYFVQHWFNLADQACEEALLDSTSLRRFVGIDLGRERVPDGTTLLKFRHLLEEKKLGAALFSKVGELLQAKGMKVGTGTIVDATIISAPSSTKNEDKARDPEMHQTQKGNQWYFGMKLHIGVDSQTGLAHSAVVTAANVHDKHPMPDLLHGGRGQGLGRQRVCIPAGADRQEGAAGPGLYESACAAEQPDGRSRKDRQPHQVEGAPQGRACLRRDQETVGLRQGALPGPGEERQPGIRGAGPGQHLPGAQAPGGIGASAGRQSGAAEGDFRAAGPQLPSKTSTHPA